MKNIIKILLPFFILVLSAIIISETESSEAAESIEQDYFEIYDIAEFGQCAWGMTSADFDFDGFLDFAVSYSTSPFNYSTISIFYNDGSLGFTQEDVYTFSYVLDLVIEPLQVYSIFQWKYA